LGSVDHSSCLLLTSREKPPELAALEGGAVRSLRLAGLDLAACRALLHDKQLLGDTTAWEALVARYGGNGLALKLVGETIAELFGGEIASFLAVGVPVFGSIGELLATQLGRLSDLELALLHWLAVAREPVAAADLLAMSMAPVARSYLLEALEGLRRRNLVERGATWPEFSLQPMVMEYVTERLVDQARAEILAGELQALRQHALVQASAPKHVQRSQMRAIVQPLLDELLRANASTDALVARIRQLLAAVQALPGAQQGYGGSNLHILVIAAGQDLCSWEIAEINVSYQPPVAQAGCRRPHASGADRAQARLGLPGLTTLSLFCQIRLARFRKELLPCRSNSPLTLSDTECRPPPTDR
jgi:hypothetical protein